MLRNQIRGRRRVGRAEACTIVNFALIVSRFQTDGRQEIRGYSRSYVRQSRSVFAIGFKGEFGRRGGDARNPFCYHVSVYTMA